MKHSPNRKKGILPICLICLSFFFSLIPYKANSIPITFVYYFDYHVELQDPDDTSTAIVVCEKPALIQTCVVVIN